MTLEPAHEVSIAADARSSSHAALRVLAGFGVLDVPLQLGLLLPTAEHSQDEGEERAGREQAGQELGAEAGEPGGDHSTRSRSFRSRIARNSTAPMAVSPASVTTIRSQGSASATGASAVVVCS